jgi:hypothetical protein
MGNAREPVTQQDIYRAMTPAERVAAGCALHDFAFERMVVYLRGQHPEKSEREILVMATRRFLGDAARVL